MTERNLFEELKSGLEDARHFEQGKLTLKTTKLESKPSPRLTAEQIRSIREKYNMSRAKMMRYANRRNKKFELQELIKVVMTEGQ